MSKIMSKQEVKHHADHASNKLREGSSEHEMVEALAISHMNMFSRLEKLEEMNHDKFGAIQELAFALWKENPAIYESICQQNSYLSMLSERIGEPLIFFKNS